jgi:hypothetical protein
MKMARKNTPKVYKRVPSKDPILRKMAETLISNAFPSDPIMMEILADFDIYCVNQRRGVCHNYRRYLTVPLWSFTRPLNKDENYWIYYLAHELSHIYAADLGEGGHGSIFMKIFKMICPEELQYHEYGYKPRNAAAAGVSLKGKGK